MVFRPCIDLHAGKVKQIVGSSLTGNDAALVTNFEAKMSAEDFAKMYQSDDLKGGHVIMLGDGCEEAALAALRAYPGGLQIGGGVTPESAQRYVDAGASHVIVTSYLFSGKELDFEKLKKMEGVVGKEKLVVDLSCRRKAEDGPEGPYYVVKDKWQTYTDFQINRENLAKLSKHCDEFLVHGVDVEGLKVGILEDLVVLLGDISPLPVTYAGGARSIEDLQRVTELGRGKVDLTIGSALDIFGGALSYSDVVEWDKRNGYI
ncbi:phosphoribosylformimino-5-aminoimidazole carboxamide ribotide isomerase [Nannochloropsis oceanica]